MLTFQNNTPRISWPLLLLIVSIAGCKWGPSGIGETTDAPGPGLVDLWVRDAIDFIQDADRSKPADLLKAEATKEGIVVKMYLSGEKEIYKASVGGGSGIIHDYYFDDGLLTYSRHYHTEPDNRESWLMAYAQLLPYACAIEEADGTVKEALPTQAPVKKSEINEVIFLVEKYEFSEQNTSSIRIVKKDTIFTGYVSPEQFMKYTLNASRGDKLRIKLLSENPHIFFTLKPANGADMERRQWEGAIAQTGDIHISVFAAREEGPMAYALQLEGVK